MENLIQNSSDKRYERAKELRLKLRVSQASNTGFDPIKTFKEVMFAVASCYNEILSGEKLPR